MPWVWCVTGSLSKKQYGSNGLALKRRHSNVFFSSTNHKYGASTRPYAPFNSCTNSFCLSFNLWRISSGGSIPSTRWPCSHPRRNAVCMSKLWMSQCGLAAYCKISMQVSCSSLVSHVVCCLLQDLWNPKPQVLLLAWTWEWWFWCFHHFHQPLSKWVSTYT